MNEKEKIIKKIEGLRAELEALKASLPAHSIRPHQLMRIEEIEEEIETMEEELERFEKGEKPDP